MTAPNPGFGELIVAPPGGYEALPDPVSPYYVAAREGMFLHRGLAIGRGMVPVTTMPKTLNELKTTTGFFEFTAPPIPKEIMAQVVSFFRRIYARQKTEAAILLTMNQTTKEWGVFVPTQMVNHGGVNYVYDPAHVRRNGHIVVGSIHSHCDFSAFHSGTDTGDAADFDGFHATIGFITRDVPQIVAMASLNKKNFHYKEDLHPELFDYSDLNCAVAPAWWDRYVEDTNQKIKPVGHELYAKFNRPTTVVQHNFGYGYTPQHTTVKSQTGLRRATAEDLDRWRAWASMNDDELDNWGLPGYYRPAQPLRESEEFNQRKAAERGIHWAQPRLLEAPKPKNSEDPWIDAMGEGAYDLLFLSNTELLTDDDLATALEIGDRADKYYWQGLLTKKVFLGINVLRAMGLDIQVNIQSIQPPSRRERRRMRREAQKGASA